MERGQRGLHSLHPGSRPRLLRTSGRASCCPCILGQRASEPPAPAPQQAGTPAKAKVTGRESETPLSSRKGGVDWGFVCLSRYPSGHRRWMPVLLTAIWGGSVPTWSGTAVGVAVLWAGRQELQQPRFAADDLGLRTAP